MNERTETCSSVVPEKPPTALVPAGRSTRRRGTFARCSETEHHLAMCCVSSKAKVHSGCFVTFHQRIIQVGGKWPNRALGLFFFNPHPHAAHTCCYRQLRAAPSLKAGRVTQCQLERRPLLHPALESMDFEQQLSPDRQTQHTYAKTNLKKKDFSF